MIEDNAWVAFTIKDKFLSKNDDSGFNGMVYSMLGDSFHILQMNHYCHRLSISGEPLYYYAIVGKTVKKSK